MVDKYIDEIYFCSLSTMRYLITSDKFITLYLSTICNLLVDFTIITES